MKCERWQEQSSLLDFNVYDYSLAKWALNRYHVQNVFSDAVDECISMV